ncbi:MAG: thioredoxin [Acidobacteria bacterium]|jgi:thioredoxin 1|nr:thioredoxin [Acidobacteriota bacterium]
MAGKTTAVTTNDFDSVVLNASQPAIVDFWAVWCGPCRTVGPIVENIAEEYEGKALVAKLDVDSNRDVAVRYGIQAIPTLLFFKNGEVVDRIVGAADKRSITSKLDALL